MKNLLKKITFLLFVCLFLSPRQTHAYWGSPGPYGGSVKCLAVIDTFVYVGTPNGGLYRSTTRQVSDWQAFNMIMPTGKINAITNLGSIILVGSGDQGILFSSDNGESWSKKNTGLSNLNVLSLVVSGTTIYAGTNGGGVFKSVNNGDSWTAVNSGLSNLKINTLASASTIIVAGTNGGGVFYSMNGGTSWSAANTGLTNLTITSLATSSNTVYASTQTGGVFTASAANFSWSPSNTGLTNTTVFQVYISGSTAYAATGGGVFTSPTTSVVWTANNTGLAKDTVKAITVFENKLIAGTAISGLYTSPLTAINWTEHNNNFNNLKTYSLYVNGNLLIVATEKGVYVSKDLASSFTLSNHGLDDSLHVSCFAFSGTTLYAGTLNAGLYTSADTGKTWQAINPGTSFSVIKLLAATSNQLVCASDFDAAMQSTALNPISWEQYAGGFQSNSTITSLLASADGNTFYAGTNDNGMSRRAVGEDYWSPFNSGMYNQHVSAISILGNKIFGATPNNGVFVSNLSSNSWSLANTGLPDLHITSMNTSGPYVLVGYKGGVAGTSNNGASWVQPNELLYIPSYTPVTNIAFSATKIFITTPYNSIYSNSKTVFPGWTVTGMDDEESTDKENVLIFPNPNNGTFKLHYNTLNSTIKEISIYNYSGQLMNTFSGEEESISVSYPKGIYLVRLKTKTNEWITQKMTIEN